MKRMFAAAFALLMLGGGDVAQAQDLPRVRTEDPRLFAQAFADSMTLGGIAPLRQLFTDLVGNVSAEVEAALLVYERARLQLPARLSRIAADQTVGDTFRTIYVYHYFGENAWLFTRLDFVRISENEWAMSALSFGDQWARVAIITPAPVAVVPRRP